METRIITRNLAIVFLLIGIIGFPSLLTQNVLINRFKKILIKSYSIPQPSESNILMSFDKTQIVQVQQEQEPLPTGFFQPKKEEEKQRWKFLPGQSKPKPKPVQGSQEPIPPILTPQKEEIPQKQEETLPPTLPPALTTPVPSPKTSPKIQIPKPDFTK